MEYFIGKKSKIYLGLRFARGKSKVSAENKVKKQLNRIKKLINTKRSALITYFCKGKIGLNRVVEPVKALFFHPDDATRITKGCFILKQYN